MSIISIATGGCGAPAVVAADQQVLLIFIYIFGYRTSLLLYWIGCWLAGCLKLEWIKVGNWIKISYRITDGEKEEAGDTMQQPDRNG